MDGLTVAARVLYHTNAYRHTGPPVCFFKVISERPMTFTSNVGRLARERRLSMSGFLGLTRHQDRELNLGFPIMKREL